MLSPMVAYTSRIIIQAIPARVIGGLHGGRARRLVNSKGIMEVTVERWLRKAQRRMSADGSGHI